MSTPAKKLLSPEAQQVLDQARALPREEQLHLADALVGETSELSPAWQEEIERRVEAYERGELETVDGQQVFERIEAKYAR